MGEGEFMHVLVQTSDAHDAPPETCAFLPRCGTIYNCLATQLWFKQSALVPVARFSKKSAYVDPGQFKPLFKCCANAVRPRANGHLGSKNLP